MYSMYQESCNYYLCLLGMEGTMFTGLSAGQHSIDVRFTPAGSTIPTGLQRQTFNIGSVPMPTTCEHQLYNSGVCKGC